MIAGLGIDMIEVDRVAEKINKESGFRELLFSANEITYCESKTNKFEYYAARFAAKEALFKALGTGWLEGTAFNEIEIIHTTNGKPVFKFTGATATVIDLMEFSNISVSLTHLKATASAIVIIEKK
jgi:holo-[acyl-carrier protein] synthase